MISRTSANQTATTSRIYKVRRPNYLQQWNIYVAFFGLYNLYVVLQSTRLLKNEMWNTNWEVYSWSVFLFITSIMKSLLIVAVWFSHKSHHFLLTYRVFLSANQNSECNTKTKKKQSDLKTCSNCRNKRPKNPLCGDFGNFCYHFFFLLKETNKKINEWSEEISDRKERRN